MTTFSVSWYNESSITGRTHMANKEWHVIGRGFNGWHAKGVNVSSSGGDIVPRTFWTGERMTPYTEEAVEGALVYDAPLLFWLRRKTPDHVVATDALDRLLNRE